MNNNTENDMVTNNICQKRQKNQNVFVSCDRNDIGTRYTQKEIYP